MAGIEPALVYLQLIHFLTFHAQLRGCASFTGVPRLTPLCHNAGLPAYSVWLFTSPRPVHCSARCLTDDLNSVTGLMCDNGYVAILFQRLNKLCMCCTRALLALPVLYCYIYIFSYKYIIVCASCLVCNYFTVLMNHPLNTIQLMTFEV